MAASTDNLQNNEGIYTGLNSPHHDVYSTLGQTSFNSPRAQHPEKRGRSSHPCRLAAVCLGLLCALLLAATLVLCVLYTSLFQNNSMLERDLQELRANNSTKNKENGLQSTYSEVLKKLIFMEQYCPFSSQKRECNPCPEDWYQFSSKCYYFSFKTKNWVDSHIDCIQRGADLVIIESEEEQEFITRFTSQNRYWIGQNDSEGNWLWMGGMTWRKTLFRREPMDDHYTVDCAKRNVNEMAHLCTMYWNWICETNALLP